jgi:ABC-2 type transport system ATP-binding protein
VIFNGQPMTLKLTEKIGYLPEERGLYKKMKVGEQLLYLARLKGLSKPDAVAKIKGWFKKLDISAWWDKNVEDLSKGMQQKVQFVATVLHEPKLIILDEPFSGFDPVNANVIKDEILELREKGATIIFSTHRMESVEELCDHIAMINNSKKIIDGSKHDIKNSFKTNTYIIEHDQPIELVDSAFAIGRQERLEEGYYSSEVQILNDHTSNDLLHELMVKSRIISFKEKIPSINDIFISQVKSNDNA